MQKRNPSCLEEELITKYRFHAHVKHAIFDGFSTVVLYVDGMDWISPGGVRYRAPEGDIKFGHIFHVFPNLL